MLEKFAAFSAKFQAKQYFLCHLYEIGRKEIHMWRDEHAEIATRMISERLPYSRVRVPRIGESYALFEEGKEE